MNPKTKKPLALRTTNLSNFKFFLSLEHLKVKAHLFFLSFTADGYVRHLMGLVNIGFFPGIRLSTGQLVEVCVSWLDTLR